MASASKKESVNRNLRSVLITEKAGVALNRLQGNVYDDDDLREVVCVLTTSTTKAPCMPSHTHVQPSAAAHGCLA